MTPVFIQRVGICAPGLADWPAARAVLTGAVPFSPDVTVQLDSTALPATERRRANLATRWALHAAGEAVRGLPPATIAAMPTVFASADGDGDVLATVLCDLAAEKVALSPTTFHNSVYNAPAGYWSIAVRSPAASTTICAGAATFAAGLLEACAQSSCGGDAVLLVAYDQPFPAAAPIRTRARHAFACAWVLSSRADGALARIRAADVADVRADATPADVREAFAYNAAAAALPLLTGLARGASAVELPYVDGRALTLQVSACG